MMKKPTRFDKFFQKLAAICFVAAMSHPSVFSQNFVKNADKNPPVSNATALRIGGGGHILFVDGPKGVFIGMGFEKPFARRWSWSANADFFINPNEILPKFNQMRFSFQPDVRFYFQQVLRGGYVGGGLGYVIGFGKYSGSMRPDGSPILADFSEESLEMRLGWQQFFRKKHFWNAYIAAGLLRPNDFSAAIPMFRAGLQVGVQR